MSHLVCFFDEVLRLNSDYLNLCFFLLLNQVLVNEDSKLINYNVVFEIWSSHLFHILSVVMV